MQIKKGWIGWLLCLPCLTYAAGFEHVRELRYCEVIVSEGFFNFAVYNTMGLNHCPQRRWEALTTAQVKQETQSFIAILNGPRYWTMDSIQNKRFVKPEKKVFGGIPMRKAAYVQMSPLDLLRGARPYHTRQVDRDTIFTYDAGKRVYELVDPEGHVYVMQSYSLEKEEQTELNLVALGSKLKLPRGWHYKTGYLAKTMMLKTQDKKAVVIQDDLMNTYQRAAYDFLK